MTPYSIVTKKESQEYVESLMALNKLIDFDSETPEVLWAMQKARQLTPMELCVLSYMLSDAIMQHTYYIESLISEGLFDLCHNLRKEHSKEWNHAGIAPFNHSRLNKQLKELSLNELSRNPS